jgi:hypothetical protein
VGQGRGRGDSRGWRVPGGVLDRERGVLRQVALIRARPAATLRTIGAGALHAGAGVWAEPMRARALAPLHEARRALN